MPFYEYRQNNSGGGFDYDEKRGISVHVIIEADTASHANYLAERIGLYFDGEGDCRCCGDRWREAYEEDADDEPQIYGAPVEEFYQRRTSSYRWVSGYDAFVHYLGGEIRGFGK